MTMSRADFGAMTQAKGLGRHGDNTLVHMSGDEVHALNSMVPGGLTTNPHTGLPEAFNLKKILGTALPLAAMFIPGIGQLFAPALMSMGLGAGAAGIGSTALLGGIGGALSGGGLKGAALGALTAGLGAKFMPGVQGMLGGAGGAAGATAGQLATAANAATSAAPSMLSEGAGTALARMAGAPGIGDLGGSIASTLGQHSLGAMASAAAPAAAGMAKNKLLPMLALGGLGLSLAAPKPQPFTPAVNKNPRAGQEVQDPRSVATPPPGYAFGGSGGEFQFFRPEDTTGKWHYADDPNQQEEPAFAEGGEVKPPIFDPAQFAALFQHHQITAPTAMVGAYGDNGPATMHWTPQQQAALVASRPPPPPPKPVVAPTPPPSPAPPAPAPAPQIDYANRMGGYSPSPYAAPYDYAGPSYAHGGYVQGPGDGSSDSVHTSIGGTHPASLSQGEFVIPADAVAHLGNGSSQAGSKRLHAMVKGIRQVKTGKSGLPKRI